MPRRRKHTRVYGPYPHRSKFRIILRAVDGSQVTESFAAKDEAQRARRALETAIQSENAWARVAQLEAELADARAAALASGVARTVGDLVNAYVDSRRGEILAHSCRKILEGLSSMLRDVLDEPVGSITATRAQSLYRAQTERHSVATHQKRLSRVKAVWEWGGERGWCKSDVWAKVKPIGKVRKGKPQPRRSEAVRLYQHAFDIAERCEGTQEGLAALVVVTQILLGLRAGEMLGAVGRDIDSGLWYQDHGKTANSARTIEIPDRLRALLERRAVAVGPTGRLFPYGKNWPRNCVARLCKGLGLPQYCSHAMRGLHASMAASSGVTSHEIARTLGHGRSSVTDAHYVSPDAKRARSAQRRADAFRGLDNV